MINYLKKFSLKNKTVFVVGGLGLIGKEVSLALASANAKIIILDINNEQALIFEKKIIDKEFDIHIRNFDCSDLDGIDNNFSKIVKEFGCPDIFINCCLFGSPSIGTQCSQTVYHQPPTTSMT